ncbi:DUF960 family protein [[Clostridium] fimetarium]|uniref:Uncharacterized protein n=1 Tax=[Clostridium] fimetarium TaxID=99656 RepID=A0A1I0MY43_9FIRM|nr:DUF960 family protein [[Clostridium] fimetarium]SEV93549.1 protein of unknown function [[Clostridium] fimetarium]
MEKMFGNNKKRYITRGVESKIPLKWQIQIFESIDEMQGKIELDYLQIFEMKQESKNGVKMQVIKHSQEQPKYIKIMEFKTMNECIEGKIYVIDDGSNIVMLLASEY